MVDEKRNPWTILGQKEIYDNPWINVTEYDVINPKGGKGIYGKVHFKNLALGILPLDKELNTYLVGQYRFTIDQYSWEIPEGGGDPAVDPLESAKRELLEETGLVAKNWELLTVFHLSNSVSDEYGYIYLARELEQHTAMPDETEQLVVRKITFAELYNMVEKGLITDAISIMAIQKVKMMIMEGRL